MPGPWVGEVRRLIPGSEIEAVCFLDSPGDPIAQNHTLGGRRVSALDPTLERVAGPAIRRDGRDDRGTAALWCRRAWS